jgi:hypothetical protein
MEGRSEGDKVKYNTKYNIVASQHFIGGGLEV